MTALAASDKPVSRGDIEAKLREIRGEVDSTTERAKVPAIAVGVAAVVVVVGVAFLLGRRRGKRMTTIVEVRRV
jgi:hypothetical protein